MVISINSKTHGQKDVIFDEVDLPLVESFQWHIVKYNAVLYSTSYRPGVKSTKMHRLILGITDPKIVVDHINGDGLDNRRSNLRVCSTAENLANKRTPSNNTTGFKGVSKYNNRYRAAIETKDKQIYLGLFKSAVDAAFAYNVAALRIFGKFSRLNVLPWCIPNVDTKFRIVSTID